MTLFVTLLLPLVVGLGFWQLERAEEKRRLEETYLDRLSALPVPVSEGAGAFQRVRLTGRYDEDRYFLLDNQTRNGAVGFAVISVFLGGDGRRWLIRRGFVSGDPRRERLPEVSTPRGSVTLVGVVWPDLGMMPMFDDAVGGDHWPDGWPKVVQRVELQRMADSIRNGAAMEIRLEAGQPGVLEAPLMEMNMPAGKHTGYAVQWFGLALALAVGFIVFGYRKS
jgi:cytochrome oxidase assembly protein ShyY1